VVEDEAVHFCTGLREQKARNLEHPTQVSLTTGNNAWAQGLDVVVEGTAGRVADRDTLQRLADAYEAKYGSDWHFDVGDGVFGTGEDAAAVFQIEPAKVLAFASSRTLRPRTGSAIADRLAPGPPISSSAITLSCSRPTTAAFASRAKAIESVRSAQAEQRDRVGRRGSGAE
jgi:hypothetical protein